MATLIHLVRHAEVHNPRNVWYGRLDGFHLSERGLRQAETLGEHFASQDLAAVYCSPLERAWQTAEAIAKPKGLDIVPEPDIIESETRLEGKYGDLRLFRNPLNLRFFINPYRPSWGESYTAIAERMLSAVERMRTKHEGEEVVAVSHMTPIAVARLRAEGGRRPAWRSRVRCARGSITTLEFDGERLVGTRYDDFASRVS
ncbi:MAG: histidine phosphatase family protein [Actinomycetota bacterium]